MASRSIEKASYMDRLHPLFCELKRQSKECKLEYALAFIFIVFGPLEALLVLAIYSSIAALVEL